MYIPVTMCDGKHFALYINVATLNTRLILQHLLCMKFSIRNSNQFEFVPQQKQILAIETKIYLNKVLHKVLLA